MRGASATAAAAAVSRDKDSSSCGSGGSTRTTAACAVPRKYIDADHTRLDVFRRSPAFAKVLYYVQACAMSVRGVAYTARCPADVTACCPAVRYMTEQLFPRLHAMVDAIPLEDMAQQRFGNRAKRVFHAQLDAVSVELMTQLARTLPSMRRRGGGGGRQQDDGASAQPALPLSSASREQQTQQTHNNDDDDDDDDDAVHALAVELAAYLRDAFGNATRLDYGTGHELHFVMLLIICLAEHGDTGAPLLYAQHDAPPRPQPAPHASDADNNNDNKKTTATTATHCAAYELFALPPHVAVPAPLRADTTISLGSDENDDTDDRLTLHALRQQHVMYVFYEYLRFVRRLQTHYSLEPAGSHGAWGLDDYHHVPFIFGAAQLIGAESAAAATTRTTATTTTTATTATTATTQQAIVPADVCDKHKVSRYAEAYLYFAMVHWVLTHKSGPFAEHSNMLYNISGVGTWAKIYSGMVKMYAAEVLSKFNVAQHILFGRHFAWPAHDVTGTRTMHGYTIVERMAAGSCGVVFRVQRRRDGVVLVMKRIALHELTDTQRREAAQELLLMRELQHPHIVALRDAFLFNEHDLCIIMDYYDGGDLDSVLAAQREADAYVPLRQVMLWFVQMLLAVHYLHTRGVVHRDLKTHNVFIDRRTHAIAIGDLGIAERLDAVTAKATTAAATTAAVAGSSSSSRYTSSDAQHRLPQQHATLSSARVAELSMVSHGVPLAQQQAMKGTPLYMAPELLLAGNNNSKDAQGHHTRDDDGDDVGSLRERADVWSLGCILYELLSLHHPFESREMGGLLLRITRAAYAPLPRHYPAVLQHLVAQMLCVDAARRPTCAQLLRSPCVQSYLALHASMCRAVPSREAAAGDATSSNNDNDDDNNGNKSSGGKAAVLALDMTAAQRNMHAQMQALLLPPLHTEDDKGTNTKQQDEDACDGNSNNYDSSGRDKDEAAVMSVDALEAAVATPHTLPSVERAAAEREVAEATAATSLTLMETALLSHAPSLSLSQQQQEQQQQAHGRGGRQRASTHDTDAAVAAARGEDDVQRRHAANDNTSLHVASATASSSSSLHLSLRSELPPSSYVSAMQPTESMRPFMIYDRTLSPVVLTPPASLAAQPLPMLLSATTSSSPQQATNDEHYTTAAAAAVHDKKNNNVTAAAAAATTTCKDDDDDMAAVDYDDNVADMRNAPLDVLVREVERTRAVVLQLMRQHAQREQQRQRHERHAAEPSTTTLPSEAALRHWLSLCSKVHSRRLRRYVERRASLQREVLTRLSPAVAAAVYTYYRTHNILERQPHVVAALVPSRADWCVLPAVADMVALDAFVREHAYSTKQQQQQQVQEDDDEEEQQHCLS